ncbi:MAG: putative dehydrogenase [Fibrobacteres bacterium]|nr:putative dehydrogenase [Fibrobacterota bacterium]
MQKLRVGIAGYGVVGKRRRIIIDSHAALKTVAVSDASFGEDGKLEDGIPFFNDFRKLFELELDVLFVCLPNFIAAEATISGLRKGMHVFCEKPPGRDIKDIEAVIREERKHPGLKLKYGFNHRYHLSVKDSRALVKSGELGGIINVMGVYGKSHIIPFDKGWRAERRLAGGGILLDQGIHMVDLMRLFCGDFEEVTSFISNEVWKHDVEDNAYAMMKNRRGQVAMLHSSATKWQHRFSLDLTLERGYIRLSGILSGSKSYGEETMTIGRRPQTDTGNPREELVRYLQDPSWNEEIEEFADCILGDKPVVEGSSLDALKTMWHIYRIYCADARWKAAYGLDDSISPDMGL